ncbi:hypothetical protein D5047_22190 [Verminephrobacter eiseniae]|nr:hypothetical protein [Verminephrobacter eiseniae]
MFTASCALLLGLSGCGGGGGGAAMLPLPPVGMPTSPPADTGRGRVVQTSVKSEATGATYPPHIYLPSGYDSATTAYPAIYITDGDAIFNQNVTRFQNYHGHPREGRQKGHRGRHRRHGAP